jgi:hypothetical protein
VNECVLVNVDKGNNEGVCDDILGYGKNCNKVNFQMTEYVVINWFYSF